MTDFAQSRQIPYRLTGPLELPIDFGRAKYSSPFDLQLNLAARGSRVQFAFPVLLHTISTVVGGLVTIPVAQRQFKLHT